MPKLRCNAPEGAFYLFVDVSETGMSGEEFVNFMIDHGVGTVPGTAFGQSAENFIRISYAASMEEITECVDRIRRALDTLS